MLENTPFCFIEDCARGMLKMAVRWKTLGNTVAACGVGAGIWFLYMTRDIQLIPLASADRIFHSKYFAEFNPNGNPAIHDWHVKSVPLDQINPKLLDDRRKLLERFCGGVWAGNGFALQRSLHTLFDRRGASGGQIWSPTELLESDYRVGTDIAGNFEVLDRSDGYILIRGGDRTSYRSLRPLDGLIELTACIDRVKNVAEFGFKSLFFQGSGVTSKLPMSKPLVWMHEQYAKALLASGVQYVLK
ncbi:hypothetical protein CA14_010141 [Aspergillus flavus]|uniref:Uncharacterized protein n=1 Tax=Aspergillus flavus TaxID=5059 RepID=A0AB74C1D3_ASPFL|nr:hypothetical protein CA14_010141 [Aspergillus flavus]